MYLDSEGMVRLKEKDLGVIEIFYNCLAATMKALILGWIVK